MISLLVSLSILAAGNQVIKAVIRQKMISYALASARDSDGAANLVVMDGRSGYIGSSTIQLKYIEDGYISIKGINVDEKGQWKQIAEIELEPGAYTLTGLKGSSQEIVALILHLEDSKGAETNYWQYDEDVHFTVDKLCKASLSVRVSQYAEVEVIARPAVYRDE